MTKEDQLKRDRARAAVKRAIDRGQLVRPSSCPECSAKERFGRDGRSLIHAHHYRGYDFPLDIEWLCIDCHFVEDPRPAETDNGRAKLTWDIVREIRTRYKPKSHRYDSAGSSRSLAREFGVHNRTVTRIVRNEIWIDAALDG